jgi:predicted amidohydrolase
VFSRNRIINQEKEYDAVIYVANWPEVRSNIWSILLKARAIENQVYCIGVNRVGEDGNDMSHNGNTSIIDPWGNIDVSTEESVELVTNHELLVDKKTSIATNFPAFLDSDSFQMTVK